MDDIKKSLAGVKEFEDLDDQSLALIAADAAIEKFGQGDVILAQGIKGEHVWHILEGSVAVIQKKHDGEKVQLAVLGPGDIFGEISVFTNKPTTAEVVAEKSCRAIRIPGKTLSSLTQKNLTTMARFAKSVVYRLSDSARKRK